MTARDTPGFDGYEPLMPINRLLAFFFVEVGLCVGAVWQCVPAMTFWFSVACATLLLLCDVPWPPGLLMSL
jgi:hypothetical protein